MGHGIGTRIADEFLSKTAAAPACRTFREAVDVVAQVQSCCRRDV